MNKKLTSILTSLTFLSLSLSACSNNIIETLPESIDTVSAQATPVKNGFLDSSAEIFKALDLNQDKKVSKEEFKNLVDDLLANNKDKERLTKIAMSAFDTSDEAKDGLLTEKEFIVLNEKNFDKLLSGKNSISTKDSTKFNQVVVSQVFEAIKDAKDTISEKAFAKYLSQNKNIKSSEIQTTFNTIDTNKSKTLTKDEFSQMFNTSNKNSFLGKVGHVVGGAAIGVGLVIFLPFAWLAEKLGVFDNIK